MLRGLGDKIDSCSNIVLEILDATSEERNQAVVDHLAAAGFVLKDVRGDPWKLGMALVESNVWACRP